MTTLTKPSVDLDKLIEQHIEEMTEPDAVCRYRYEECTKPAAWYIVATHVCGFVRADPACDQCQRDSEEVATQMGWVSLSCPSCGDRITVADLTYSARPI